MLASISGGPDYMLTVWNWRQELIMLRCKAFSQDVARVSFSRDLVGILTTAGTGHIRSSTERYGRVRTARESARIRIEYSHSVSKRTSRTVA